MKFKIIRTRMCMLLRVIGRFSCVALQNAWTHDFREGLESLLKDESAVIQDVRNLLLFVVGASQRRYNNSIFFITEC